MVVAALLFSLHVLVNSACKLYQHSSAGTYTHMRRMWILKKCAPGMFLLLLQVFAVDVSQYAGQAIGMILAGKPCVCSPGIVVMLLTESCRLHHF